MIEWPAGLVGDEEASDNETMLDAARRELEEEPGFARGDSTSWRRVPRRAG